MSDKGYIVGVSHHNSILNYPRNYESFILHQFFGKSHLLTMILIVNCGNMTKPRREVVWRLRSGKAPVLASSLQEDNDCKY